MSIEMPQTQLSSLILLFVLLISILIAIYFSVKSGDKYSVEDSEKDAQGFGDVLSEAEGPITTFLIIAYIVLIIWAVLYLLLYL